MSLAWLGIKGHRDLILEFDSLKAFTFISSRVVETHNSWVLLSDIKNLCTRDWMVCFQHTPQKGNFVADFLAKLGVNQVISYIY